MNEALLDDIVRATLYNGYTLYPFKTALAPGRPQFPFGRVYPEAYSAFQNGSEPCLVQAECLAQARCEEAAVEARVRFLHLTAREAGEPSWRQAVEREAGAGWIALQGEEARRVKFYFPASRDIEGMRQERVEGTIGMTVHRLGDGIFKISVCVRNHTAMTPSDVKDTAAVMRRLFASTHIVLRGRDAEFVSQMEPPARLRTTAESMRNIGLWPALIGDERKAERELMLASPVVLQDYPQLAADDEQPQFDSISAELSLTLDAI